MLSALHVLLIDYDVFAFVPRRFQIPDKTIAFFDRRGGVGRALPQRLNLWEFSPSGVPRGSWPEIPRAEPFRQK